MRVDQLPDLSATTFELRHVLSGSTWDGFSSHSEVELFPQDESGQELLLVQGEHRALVRCSTPNQQTYLRGIIGSGAPSISWIVHAGKNLVLQVHRFRSALLLESPLLLLVDDLVLGELRKRFRIDGTGEDVQQWLREQIQLDSDAKGRLRLVVQSSDRDVTRGFRILGPKLCLDVEQHEEYLRVVRVSGQAGSHGPMPQLIWGQVSLVDTSASAGLAAAARAQLAEALAAGDSYLAMWRHYQKLDEELVQERAQSFGALPYQSVKIRGNTLRFELSSPDAVPEKLALLDDSGIFLEAVTESESPAQDGSSVRRRDRNHRPFLSAFRRVTYDGNAVEVDNPEDGSTPPASGILRLSMRGDEVRLRRRRAAEERLRSGNLPLPHLGLLLEGKPSGVPRYAHRSPGQKVLREAFRNQPTEQQRTAIEVAINTPDIALIQGPPGTGKTQVITALERCLAELGEREGDLHHRILVTSTQHEAVDNIIARTDIFGIPPIKVGRRRGAQERLDAVDRWCLDRIEKIQGRSAEKPEPEKLIKARRIAVRCLVAPSAAGLVGELEELECLSLGLVAPSFSEQLRALLHRLRSIHGSEDTEARELLLRAAHAIRLEPVAFLDDGPQKAQKALVRLDSWLSLEERSFLKDCADWLSADAPPWLQARGEPLIEALRDRLRAATDSKENLPPGLQGADQELLRTILDEMTSGYLAGRGGEDAVLADYLDDLENDPQGLRMALQHYTVVLAATCQQASSEQMLRAREQSAGSVSFETVIVDEAARSHPLDLFIPMTMAQRRIVLVGDHRQLPHMLEPEVEKAFLAGQKEPSQNAAEVPDPLRESLFSRLWSLLKQLEREDGIQRTVTLDTQFRMHPSLGHYLSKQFYEQGTMGHQVHLKSGLPAEHFSHALSRYQRNKRPCCAAWIDVPGGTGREERSGRSKDRHAEAIRVATEVRLLLEESPDLTVGVIAFYSAQVRLIFDELCRLGVAESLEGGGFQIKERFRVTSDRNKLPVERLRVGTVDAFQGKEFDVVLLSVTRSNNLPEGNQEQLRRKYGHLLLPNRLCVAMSRQRRLLIVFGDKMFIKKSGPLAPMKAFLQLCEGPDGCVL